VYFARGISPNQKWWQTLWEEKFHASNGKAMYALKVPRFFSF
jgi:hypothetical protein